MLLCVAVAGAFFACDRNTTFVEEVAGPAGCTDCHVADNLITGKQTEWAASRHGTGTVFEEEGTNKSCAGCHSGNAFAERIAAGLDPNEVQAGDTDPTRQDCRACHKIHETYTKQDLALRTESPVALFAIAGSVFDGGLGNLCVNCHQPRRNAPVAANGVVTGITTHWGPHHGPQSSMILGVGGALVTPGSPSGHYAAVDNTCVQCHMGDDRDHHFEPNVARCQPCHPGATDFDINGVQTEVDSLASVLGDQLVALGLLSENSIDGHPTVTSAPEAQAFALWNWLYVHHEDRSRGVHNSDYTIAMLQAGLTALNPTAAPQAAQVPSRIGAGGTK
jgi:formate-dependent nitrite reductase cytochrome c552 subunit